MKSKENLIISKNMINYQFFHKLIINENFYITQLYFQCIYNILLAIIYCHSKCFSFGDNLDINNIYYQVNFSYVCLSLLFVNIFFLFFQFFVFLDK